MKNALAERRPRLSFGQPFFSVDLQFSCHMAGKFRGSSTSHSSVKPYLVDTRRPELPLLGAAKCNVRKRTRDVSSCSFTEHKNKNDTSLDWQHPNLCRWQRFKAPLPALWPASNAAIKNRAGYFDCSRLKDISVHPLPASVEKVVGRFLSGLARQKVILFSSTR
jgi:hypothetical protein